MKCARGKNKTKPLSNFELLMMYASILFFTYTGIPTRWSCTNYFFFVYIYKNLYRIPLTNRKERTSRILGNCKLDITLNSNQLSSAPELFGRNTLEGEERFFETFFFFFSSIQIRARSLFNLPQIISYIPTWVTNTDANYFHVIHIRVITYKAIYFT